MIDLYRLNLKYNMFGGMVIPHQPEIEILLYGILAAEALCTLHRVLRYLRSRRQVQWLIATEAIARPSAPTSGATGRSTADDGSGSDIDSDHYSHSRIRVEMLR